MIDKKNIKITERMYVDKLEEMVRLHKDDVCDHCPMSEDFDPSASTICEVDKLGRSIDINKSCNICRYLTWKYAYSDPQSHSCPCQTFEETETNMAGVAWQVILGWRKNHPEVEK